MQVLKVINISVIGSGLVVYMECIYFASMTRGGNKKNLCGLECKYVPCGCAEVCGGRGVWVSKLLFIK